MGSVQQGSPDCVGLISLHFIVHHSIDGNLDQQTEMCPYAEWCNQDLTGMHPGASTKHIIACEKIYGQYLQSHT